MTIMHSITITRAELYRLVWKTPLIKLAKEYNLSDVGLRKICVKHKIPTPPAGYWAKVANGQTPAQLPLPIVIDASIDTIEIVIKPTVKEPVENKYQKYYDEFGVISDDIFKVEPITSLDQLHPLLKSSFKNLKEGKADPGSHIRATEYPCASVHVTKGQLERALFVMHSLFKAFESQGFSLPVDTNHEGMQSVVVVHGMQLNISLTEKIDAKEIIPDKTKKQTYAWSKEYEYIPTGILTFSIADEIRDVQRKWSDNTRGKLEDKIFDIVSGVLFAAMWKKIRKDERDEWNRQWKERQRREAEDAEKRKIEKENYEKLLNEVQKWRISEDLRAYIEAAKNAYTVKYGSIQENTEFYKWLNWAEKIANDADPINML